MCTYIANGTKIKNPNNCNGYITCINAQPVYGSCEEDLFYDRNTASCVDPSSITCLSTDPCASSPGYNGFVADPYSCNGYYYCANGVGTRGLCSSGLNFNPETQNCIRNFPCEITMLPEDYCNIVPDGIFIKVPGTCTDYQTCWRETLFNGTCPETFFFNAFTGLCDYPSNVNCEEATTLAPTIPADVECTVSGVFISDGRTCNGYYYCRAMPDDTIDLVHGECPIDRFFTPEDGGACVIRTNLKCRFDRCVTMGLDFMQMANIDNDGCVGFSICQNGEEIAKASCPSGEYFDEMSQLCTTEVISYPACALSNTTETTTTPSIDTTTIDNESIEVQEEVIL